jgi:DNA gyrase/topoisomerase IV subunit A
VVTITRAGYIKAVSADAFRPQSRGGRGVQGTRLKEEDLITEVVHTTALAHILLFSNQGKVYRMRAHEIPMKERTARGTPAVNLISLAPDERIQAIVETKTFDPDRYLLFATKSGQVKKTPLASTTSHDARASSPSTFTAATSWCGCWRRVGQTTSSWCLETASRSDSQSPTSGRWAEAPPVFEACGFAPATRWSRAT